MGKCHDMPRSGGSRRPGMMKPDEVEAMLGLYELVGERSASRRNASGEPEGLTAERACQFGRADQRANAVSTRR